MKPGDKVICVDYHKNDFYGHAPTLIEGVPYVVQEVGHYAPSGEDYINLIGVPAPHKTVGWLASRFRKLEDLKGKQEHERSIQTRTRATTAFLPRQELPNRDSATIPDVREALESCA